MDKQDILKFLSSLEIDLVGSFPIDAFNPFNEFFKVMKNKDYLSDFSNNDFNTRVNPKTLLKSCTHIIVIGLPYLLSSSKALKGYGHLSAQGVGVDYHIKLNNKLEILGNWLKKNIDDLEYKICVDTTPLSDRDIAYTAGLGFWGKNNFIISPTHGTAFNIGYLLVNKELPTLGQPIKKDCGKCRNCIEACPGGALSASGLNTKRCISELTQKKEILSYKQRELIGINIYGCDICQRVCPYNHHKRLLSVKDSSIDLVELAQMSNKGFHKTYKERGFHWRGNGIIKRNAIIAMGNIGDEKFIQILEKLLQHPSETIRIYALWALYKLKPLQIDDYNLIEEVLTKEIDFLKMYYEKV